MQGKIIKGIAGFYYIETEQGLYECKAKGAFRNQKKKPLVGDNVEISIQDEENKKEPVDSSNCGKCGSGSCYFCGCQSCSESKFIGSFFDYYGTV